MKGLMAVMDSTVMSQDGIDALVARIRALVDRYDGHGDHQALAKVRSAYGFAYKAPNDARGWVLVEEAVKEAEAEAPSKEPAP